MTNTAKILNFGRGNFAEQERNVADLDDGYPVHQKAKAAFASSPCRVLVYLI